MRDELEFRLVVNVENLVVVEERAEVNGGEVLDGGLCERQEGGRNVLEGLGHVDHAVRFEHPCDGVERGDGVGEERDGAREVDGVELCGRGEGLEEVVVVYGAVVVRDAGGR